MNISTIRLAGTAQLTDSMFKNVFLPLTAFSGKLLHVRWELTARSGPFSRYRAALAGKIFKSIYSVESGNWKEPVKGTLTIKPLSLCIEFAKRILLEHELFKEVPSTPKPLRTSRQLSLYTVDNYFTAFRVRQQPHQQSRQQPEVTRIV
jgi:hypothetical protein